MPNLNIIEFDGTSHEVIVNEGCSVMRAAIDNGIDGVTAECGGALACATCHVLVDPEWLDRLPEPTEAEEDMLQFVYSEQSDNSRLSCQIAMSDELNGMTVRLPESQL